MGSPPGAPVRRRGPARARPWTAAWALAAVAVAVAGCWRVGEGTSGEARVTWAAYPDTVVAGEAFSFEFAGPVAHSACGRLDTAILSVADSTIRLDARRTTFDAMCAGDRVSFYQARAIRLERPGSYAVLTADGRPLGTLMVRDSGRFSPMRAVGEGTLERAGGCLVFGPGWTGNQRPFALRDAPESLDAEAGTDRVVGVAGRLVGFTSCSWYGSRPTIRVDSVWMTDRKGSDYYE